MQKLKTPRAAEPNKPGCLKYGATVFCALGASIYLIIALTGYGLTDTSVRPLLFVLSHTLPTAERPGVQTEKSLPMMMLRICANPVGKKHANTMKTVLTRNSIAALMNAWLRANFIPPTRNTSTS